MRKQSTTLIILTFLNLSVLGQLKINSARPIPFSSQFDSTRIRLSKLCLSDLITESKANVDIRIYRFMAFGDKKLIRISTLSKDNLFLEIFSVANYADSIIYDKKFDNWRTGLKSKAIISKYNVLNLPDLDYDFIRSKQLATVNDGNVYYVEAKIGRDFTFLTFENPEIYAKHFSDQVPQAKSFVKFIRDFEKLTNTIIRDIQFKLSY